MVAGADADRLPNTSCLLLPGAAASQLMALDLEGIAVEQRLGLLLREGRAVARAGGHGGAARPRGCAIRVSLGWNSTPADVAAFLAAWPV